MAGEIKGGAAFSITAEYAPDRERVLRALLVALGVPGEEITYLLAENRRVRSEGPPQSTEKIGDKDFEGRRSKTSKQEGC